MKTDTYEVKDGELKKENPACPKCGEGIYLAEHKDRYHCGKCGYTRWKD